MILKTFTLCLALMLTTPALAFDHNYGLWKRVIAKHVDYTTAPASVNYLAIKADRLDFTENLKELVQVTEAEYKAFTTNQRKAFLLNLYGAMAIKAVLDQIKNNKLPASIKDTTLVLNDIFDEKFFKLFDKKRSLNFIIEDLAQEFKTDYRFMIAFACGAKGCPPPGYYTANNFDEALSQTMKFFLGLDKNVSYTAATKNLVASDYFKLRDKYLKISKDYPNLKNFLIRNAPIKELMKETESNVDLEYSKMDWALNKKID